jgi:hypothetical protein
MRIWQVVLASVGCWTSSTPEPVHPAPEPAPHAMKAPRKPEPERVVDVMARFRDQMCACRDKACADQVQDGMNRWSSDVAKDLGSDREDRKLGEDDIKELTAVTEAYGRCMMTAMMAGSGGNPCAGP